MTKKDYIVIAKAIVSAKLNLKLKQIRNADDAIDEVVDNLCYTFYGDNNKFDAKRFEMATNYKNNK